MSDRVAALLSDRDQRLAMGVAGRQLVLETGSLDSMVAGYQRMAIELYDQQAALAHAVGQVSREHAPAT